MNLNLGILRENGVIVNHRSLLKVILNPFLRTIGYQFATLLKDDGQLSWLPRFGKCPKLKFKWSWSYDMCERTLEKRRRLK